MKNLILSILSFTMILSLCSCGSAALVSSSASTLQTSAATTSTSEETEETTTNKSEIETTEESTTKETANSKIGSRTSPAPIGTTITITGDSMYGTIELDVTLTKVIRGVEAKKIVMKENQFNEIPSGKEVILIWVETNLTKFDPSDDNEGFFASDGDFDFFDSTMTGIENESVVVPKEFYGEMFEGGSIKGYVYIVVPKGEKVTARYEEIAWFDIG